MPRYKRSAAEAQLDIPAEPQVSPEHAQLLSELRNMWEFASLMQYIFLFGHVVKIDEDFDVEDLEHECLQPSPSEKLAQIGLALLKYVSSHRGLTPEIFEEYARRQYQAKAQARNPFGDGDQPTKFNDLDIFTRIRVLQQLSTWTLGNAERIRNMMPPEEDDMTWRMEPLGWDKEDRAYFVLDDNRLYRRTDAPVPPPTPPNPKAKAKSKAKSKKAVKPRTRGTRSSKRQKVEATPEEEEDEEMDDAEAGTADDTLMTNGEAGDEDGEPAYGFTDKTWECIAITLEDYREFLATIFRSRDPNEKQLRKAIEENVLPILEKRAEALKQKQLKKLRELENLQKMATAKRSGRLAEKQEKERQDREVREAEEKKQAEIRMAHEEQERQKRIEEGHESRRLTREQRLKEREVKRILHEEELERLEQEASRAASQDPNGESAEAAENRKRLSERQLKTQREQHKKELEQLAEDEGNWVFDCAVCGLHGENLDDGTHSLACERCNVWQHSACHGFNEKEIENPDFHFVCGTCQRKEKREKEEQRRREEEAERPKISLKLGKSRASGSPEASKAEVRPPSAQGPRGGRHEDRVQRQLDAVDIPPPPPSIQHGYYMPYQNGSAHAYQQQTQRPPSNGQYYPPNAQGLPQPPQQPWQGSPLPPPKRPASGYAGSPSATNGYAPPTHHHQQQHQYAHQHAVQGSGAHPGYQPQQYPPQQSYGYTPRPAPTQYPMSSPSMQYSQPQQQRPPSQQGFQQQLQQPYAPGSAQLMNGFQSPVKRPPPSSPAQPPVQASPQPQQSPLIPSPKTSFPPPSNGYGSNAGHSPTKSSPPQPPRMMQRPPSQSFGHYPQPHTTPSNGQQGPGPTLNTPSQPHQSPYPAPPHTFQTPTSSFTEPPAPASANANGISADGMSGPWPESSKVIPQKHDQSPAPLPPPQSSPGTAVGPGAANVMGAGQPNLAPSPMQRAEAEKGSVPVKREVEGQPADVSQTPAGSSGSA